MFVSLQTGVAVVVSAAVLGWSSRSAPVALPPTCVCRCDGEQSLGGGADAAVPAGVDLAFTGPPWLILLLGLLLGIASTFEALRCWAGIIASLRESLEAEQKHYNRPRALAP